MFKKINYVQSRDVEVYIFVAMATRSIIGRISLTLLNCPPSKTYCLVQDSRLYLLHKPSYSQFRFEISKKNLLPWQQKPKDLGRSANRVNTCSGATICDINVTLCLVIADPMLKFQIFVIMATTVGLGYTAMTQVNSLTSKRACVEEDCRQ